MSLFVNSFPLDQIQPMAIATAQAAVSVMWQSVLLVGATWLVLRCLPRLGASARFAVWAAVFAISAGLPLLHLPATGGGLPVVTPHLRFDTRWSYALAGLWVAASLFRLGGLAVQSVRLRSLWKSASPVSAAPFTDPELAELLATRHVELCTSSEVDRPSVIGFLAPRILVPGWLYEEMTPVELRHVVLHEMEHLRRRDDWMNLLQRVALVLFPLNPALVWLDRRLASERELACDDGVLAATHMPRAYATCLASIAERRLERKLHRRVFALALGALGAGGVLRNRPEFSRRIEGILDRRRGAGPARAGAIAAALVVGVVGAGAGLARSPELVSFSPTTVATAARGTPSSSSVDLVVRPPSFRMDFAPGVRSQNVAFHQTAAPRRAKPPAASRANVAAGDLLQRVSAAPLAKRPQITPQWFVLTSANRDAPARVVVRTADGRFFVAPYAAVPVPDGWLILQL